MKLTFLSITPLLPFLGSCAGAVSVAFTYPLDLIRARLDDGEKRRVCGGEKERRRKRRKESTMITNKIHHSLSLSLCLSKYSLLFFLSLSLSLSLRLAFQACSPHYKGILQTALIRMREGGVIKLYRSLSLSQTFFLHSKYFPIS